MPVNLPSLLSPLALLVLVGLVFVLVLALAMVVLFLQHGTPDDKEREAGFKVGCISLYHRVRATPRADSLERPDRS
jgi:hypothetical protein